ncbi:MAG: AAA family ATPase [Gallionella sp.]|nr:AAA family ATPase [Gallionella sp.]
MKLTRLRISNFQSFGPVPTPVDFEAMTFLLGPNGAGKTVVLQALARLFGFDPSIRRVRRSDFHISPATLAAGNAGTLNLWIEAQFEFPELLDANGQHATIPGHFSHMQLDSADGVPRVRFRLTAILDEDGDIEEKMHYVIHVDANDEPVNPMVVPKHDRNSIQVHYLPARRDPTDHISYTASSLLGRTLRAANWHAERATVAGLTQGISAALASNAGVQGIGEQMAGHWLKLHKGSYYASPSVSFEHNEIDNLLRHLTVGFTPGHEASMVDFSRLSDGQQSLLYVSLVLSIQGIGRRVLAGQLDAFDIDRLRPAVFTLMAMEEPENSLSPHYLGRVIKALTDFAGHHDAQAVVATHAPSLLRRVQPESIRYLRLDAARCTTVRTIVMPAKTDEAHKFVREAVQAFPELYFSRLVILGEGDSEEIVLPRLFRAMGLADDDTSIAIAPLGGRHVNHFWRLLNGLQIPYVTLLDLDVGRHQAGWGRIRYAAKQILTLWQSTPNLTLEAIEALPAWNGPDQILSSSQGAKLLSWLEKQGVFFSSPLDLDFSMIQAFPVAYGVSQAELVVADDPTVKSVLGKSGLGPDQYNAEQQSYFSAYHARFKLGSKPAAHLEALAKLDDAALTAGMPPSISRLIALVEKKLADLPE